jgi:hypothetical protein
VHFEPLVGPIGRSGGAKVKSCSTTPASMSQHATPKYAAARFAASELVKTLDSGLKIKRRVPRMRACDEKNEKGAICAGHLKRWFGAPPEISLQFGSELYRCERCLTVYLPNPGETPRSATLAW